MTFSQHCALRVRSDLLLFARVVCVVALALCMGSCAAGTRPTDAGRPRGNEPPYPILLTASAERREQATNAYAALAGAAGAAIPPALQPVTATISALPTDASTIAPLKLPSVALPATAKDDAKEEALRESLRRFIAGAGALLGVAPRDLSLVARTDEPDGTRRALYQQRPFAHPLRAGFGVLDIRFNADGHVIGLASTAIPDAERLNRALNLPRQRLTSEQAVTRLAANRALTVTDADGRAQSYAVPAAARLTARELVVYPLKTTANGASALEFHLAWELAVEGETTTAGNTPQLVYLDAVTGAVIAVDSRV